MKTKTLILAAMASVIAATAAAPSYAAVDRAKKQKNIERMIKRADLNGDSKVSRDEMIKALEKTFAILDTNHDGVLTQAEVSNGKATFKAHVQQVKASGGHVSGVMRMPKKVADRFAKIDTNGDGKISESEIQILAEKMFKRRDHNNDGYISTADFKA